MPVHRCPAQRMDVRTTAYDTIYIRKARKFLIGAGLCLIITGTSVLLAATVRCQYQVMIHIDVAWMIFTGVLGIVLALGSAKEPCFAAWWYVAPCNFQIILGIGLHMNISTMVKLSCETKMLREQECRRTVDNSFTCSAPYFRPAGSCCGAGICGFLIAVEVLVSMINITIGAKHLYLKSKSLERSEADIPDAIPAYLQTEGEVQQRVEEITDPSSVSNWWARNPDNVDSDPPLETARSQPLLSNRDTGVENARPGNSTVAERNFERHPLLSSSRSTAGNGTTMPPSYEEVLAPRDFREVTIAELAVLYRLYSNNTS